MAGAIQGLQTQAQRDDAQALVDYELAEAQALLNGTWVPPDRIIVDPNDKDHPKTVPLLESERVAAIEAHKGSNHFFAILKPAYDGIAYDSDGDNNFKKRVEQLRTEALTAMIEGDKPKTFMEIAADSFQNFSTGLYNGVKLDITDPLGSLWSIPSAIMGALFGCISKTIKDIAVTYLGDTFAGQLKAVKDNYLNVGLDHFTKNVPWGTETAAQATDDLQKQNAGVGLGKYFGIADKAALDGFGHEIANKMKQENIAHLRTKGNASPLDAHQQKLRNLSHAVHDYAKIRLTDLATATPPTNERVDAFVQRYMVAVESNITDDKLLDERAQGIANRTKEIKGKIAEAGADAFKVITSTNKEEKNKQSAAMTKAIGEAAVALGEPSPLFTKGELDKKEDQGQNIAVQLMGLLPRPTVTVDPVCVQRAASVIGQ